jgi:hypothetical protein
MEFPAKHVVPLRLYSLFQPQPSIDTNQESSITTVHSGNEENGTALANQATNFSDLPFEIRTKIYRLAIPPSRVLRIRLTVIPGSRSALAQSISPPCVPVILHINRESRAEGLRIFKLAFGTDPDGSHPRAGLDGPGGAREGDSRTQYRSVFCPPSSSGPERFRSYWNPERDTLYLPLFNPGEEHPVQRTRTFFRGWDRATYDFDSGDDESDRESNDASIYKLEVQQTLSHVRHLALPLNQDTRRIIFPSYPPIIPRADISSWFMRFPHLRSLTLLVDHFPGWYRAGEIVLYEPNDGGEGFRQQEAKISSFMELWNEDKEGEPWEVPDIEVLIMGNRKTRRKPEFCVGPERSAWRPSAFAEAEHGARENEDLDSDWEM